MSRDQMLALMHVLGSLECLTMSHGHHRDDEHTDEDDEPEQEGKELDKEALEYQKGSLCGYCDYCKVRNTYTR